MNVYFFCIYFVLIDPPENITVSNPEVMVEEGYLPQRILCSAKAYPGMFSRNT